MAFDIKIETAYLVITDTSTTDYINHPLAETRFTVNSSDYRFYRVAPVADGSLETFILGGENNTFAYGDLGTVTEDGVTIPIASEAALSTYLRSKLSFFFNPDPVEIVADTTGLVTKDFLLAVAMGDIAGHSLVIVRGHNPDIDSSTEEDVWEVGGTITYLTSGETMEIASSSAQDGVAGTGALTVLVNGCSGTGAAQTEIITTNGTTDVQTLNSYLRVNSLIVLTAGTNEANVGNLTATATTAGTVQCEMDAGEGISQNSHYCVPLATTGYLYKVELNAAKISGGGSPEIEFKGMARPNGAAWLQLFDKKMDTSVTDEIDLDLPFPTAMAALTDIKFRADTDTNNTEVRTRMYLLLVED